MLKTTVFALAAGFAAGAAAQGAARPDPADPRAGAVQRPNHESAFKDYRPYRDPEVGRWRESNQEMGRLKGHAGHVPGSTAGPPAAPAPDRGQSGHGGGK